MNMVCPRCRESYDQRLVCPKCKVRLVLQNLRHDATLQLPSLPDLSTATPWSRIVIGVVLAQGIYFGLKQLCMAGLLVSGDDAASELWTSHAGPALVLTLQSVGLLLGGILAGAGQRRGPTNGFTIGTLSGLISIGVFRAEVPRLGSYSYIIDLLYLAFIGLLSGWLGMRIWKPLQELSMQLLEHGEAFGLARRKSSFNPFTGPVSWFRVVVGITVCVPPSCGALKLMFWLVNVSHGVLTIEIQQMRLFSWILTAVALLAGSIIAGSAVPNSLKQGLCVGITTIVLVFGHRLYYRGMPSFTWMLLTCSVTLGACLLGSWFGGQLLPPLAKPRKNFHIGPLAS
jgi:hypothetical protein